jgi:hypothetical protein
MATTIGSLGEPPSSRRNPSHEEWIIRICQLQETLAVGQADIAARSELAMLLEQSDQPEEALLNWNAILSCDPIISKLAREWRAAGGECCGHRK